MSKCHAVLWFETMENRVVLSASVGGLYLDLFSCPSDEPHDQINETEIIQDTDLVQKVQTVQEEEIAEDLAGETLDPDSTVGDGGGNPLMFSENINSPP